MKRVAGACYIMLEAFGLDSTCDGLKDTPMRVAKKWWELLEGYSQDPSEILSRVFESERYDEMILLKDIEFHSTCEHHLLPFSGVAKVGYIPNESGLVVGISKLARLVDCFSRRLQIQERMTSEIASALNDALKPRGVGVIVEATHTCMVCRGVKKNGASMVTSSMLGRFRDDAMVRSEFVSL